MNRFRITALEDCEVEIAEEKPRPIRVQGTVRQVPAREPPQWVRMARGEVREVVDVLGIRADMLGAGKPMLPSQPGETFTVHEALEIEALPEPSESV